jgi:hypothetical protein
MESSPWFLKRTSILYQDQNSIQAGQDTTCPTDIRRCSVYAILDQLLYHRTKIDDYLTRLDLVDLYSKNQLLIIAVPNCSVQLTVLASIALMVAMKSLCSLVDQRVIDACGHGLWVTILRLEQDHVLLLGPPKYSYALSRAIEPGTKPESWGSIPELSVWQPWIEVWQPRPRRVKWNASLSDDLWRCGYACDAQATKGGMNIQFLP